MMKKIRFPLVHPAADLTHVRPAVSFFRTSTLFNTGGDGETRTLMDFSTRS